MRTYPRWLATAYESSDGTVIAANVCDFGAVGDGCQDDSDAFLAAIAAAEPVGGAVYAPAGTYKLTKHLVIPSAVQLLGDFTAPTEEDPRVRGTILAIYTATVADGGDTPFFRLRRGSGMKGLTIWYPEQTLAGGVAEPYPYTIGLVDMVVTSLESIHFVNAYACIDHFSTTNNQQIARDISGTPLRVSVRVAHVNDSNRYERFNLQPKWWLESGLPGVPDEEALRRWLLHHATGFEMVSMDWHFLSDFTIQGYHIGLELTNAYGRVYGMRITGCNTCLSVIRAVWYGAMVTNCVLIADGGENPAALRVSEASVWGLSCHGVHFESTGRYAVEHLGNGQLSLQDCRIVLPHGGRAGLYNRRGRFAVLHSTFDGGDLHILSRASRVTADHTARIPWDGQTFRICERAGGISKIVGCSAEDGPLRWRAAEPAFVEVAADLPDEALRLDTAAQDVRRARQRKCPGAPRLFAAADYGVTPEAADIGPALQRAIDAAQAAGGGAVYLPKGVYHLESPVTVKPGVEVRGCCDVFHYVTCDATCLLSDYGDGSEDAAPLIVLEHNAGLRGLSIVYDRTDPAAIRPRATTIQGRGTDIYVINVVVSTGWFAVDLCTCRCDRHYLEGVNFYALKTGIAVGGGSVDGIVRECHSNPCTITENPHRQHQWDGKWGGSLFQWFAQNYTGFYVGETQGELFYFTFVFGTEHGVWCDEGADICVIGHGSDYSVHGLYFTGNARAVIVDPQLSGGPASNAVMTEQGFTGRALLVNPCAWAIRDAALRIKGGTVAVVGGIFFENAAAAVFADGGDITFTGVILLRRRVTDFLVYKGTRSLCAYGNIPVYTQHYLEESVEVSGSDLV